MTPDQFKQRLKDIHVSQSSFAKLVYVHPNTVSKWATGQAAIPGPVRAYLDLADGVIAQARIVTTSFQKTVGAGLKPSNQSYKRS